MTKENLISFIRHLVSLVGGILIAKGLANDSVIMEAAGALAAIAGIVWSIYDKTFTLGAVEGALRQVGTAVAAYLMFKGNQELASTITSWVGIIVALIAIILGQTDKLWQNASPKKLSS